MIKNYLTIAFRNLKTRFGFSMINVVGFAIGIACCMLIALFVQYEYSFDQMHAKKDRIYRLNKRVTQKDAPEELHAITAGLMGPAIAERFSEVEESVRLLPWFDNVLFKYAETSYKISDVVFADSNFFSVFDFSLLQGSERDALVAPLSLVLSERVATMIFGEEDPMGKVVMGLNDVPYMVTGIIEDQPANSHIMYDVLISWSSTAAGDGTLGFDWLNRWLTQVNYTYLLLQPGADPEALSARFPALMQENLPQRANEYRLYLQPLDEIYLHSNDILFNRNVRLGNATYVNVFVIVGLLILLIACINFVNLTMAQSGRRTKEIGVRKVLGAERRQISRQFFSETMLSICIGLAFAIVIVFSVLPYFNAFVDRDLRFGTLGSWELAWGMAGLIFLTVLAAAGYPSMVLSRFRPIKVLHQRSSQLGRGLTMRKVLVVTQFLASIVLIVGTVVVQRQLRYVQEKDPGFDREHVLVLPVGGTQIGSQFDAFKTELLRHPNITQAAGSNSVPGTRAQMMSFQLRPEGKPADEIWTSYVWRLDDYDLVDTYKMRMAQGRFFSENFSTDADRGIVINETLARRLGWEDAVGKQLDIPGEVEGSRVIGVVEDFHFESLHHPIEPLAFYIAPRFGNLSVRIEGGDLSEVLAFIKATWERFDPAYPFEYTFLDESAARYYDTENRLMSTLAFFASLAILIACLGLFGLAALTVQQRTKEIGIRKVIGASVSGLVTLLSKDFLRLVGIAFILSVPIAYFTSDYWLQGFTYRISVSWWIFLAAGLIAVTIAFITVGAHCFRAAIANPVKALRYE